MSQVVYLDSPGLGIRSFDFRANRSILSKNERMSNSLKKNERFTHSLIFGERNEWFAHGRSFVLSNLSESLTVAHLIWAKWANEWMNDERMSEFPALPYSCCIPLTPYRMSCCVATRQLLYPFNPGQQYQNWVLMYYNICQVVCCHAWPLLLEFFDCDPPTTATRPNAHLLHSK